jgi:hypothetical protein
LQWQRRAVWHLVGKDPEKPVVTVRHHIQSPQGTIGILHGIGVSCGSSEERSAGIPFVAELALPVAGRGPLRTESLKRLPQAGFGFAGFSHAATSG